MCIKIFTPIEDHVYFSDLLFFCVYFCDNDTLIWNIILFLHLVTYDLSYKADIMSTQKYIWLYFLLKNNGITCNICHASYTLKFSTSARFHIIKKHKEHYKNIIKKGWWPRKFYQLKSDIIKCKLCGYYKPLKLHKLSQHLIKKHQINISKVNHFST